MTQDNELLPCPFCGGPAVSWYHPSSDDLLTCCGSPQALGDETCAGKYCKTHPDAWNTRKPPPPSGDAVRLADDEFPDEVWIATDQRWYSSERHESLPSYKYIRADLIKPEPAADLNKLKIAAVKSVCGYGDADDDGWMHNLVAGTIDYLAAQGHLRPAVPREVLEKVAEALSFADAATVRIDTDEYRFCDVTFNKLRNALTEIAPYVQKA